MSTESLNATEGEKDIAEPEKTKQHPPPTPNILRHQHSFEQRYSSIIHKQIWETSINKEALERQLNAYFPFARSASLQKEGQNVFDVMCATNSTKHVSPKCSAIEGTKEKCLERLETLDIAEKCQAELTKSETK